MSDPLAQALAAILEANGAEPSECLSEALAAADMAARVLVEHRLARPIPAGSVWGRFAQAVPELAEWGAYFAAAEALRGSTSGVRVGRRAADDVLRNAEVFCREVGRRLAFRSGGARAVG